MSYYFNYMDSPVGRIKLVATDKGLAAILWEFEDFSRVKLDAPLLNTGFYRHRFSAKSLECLAQHSFWQNNNLLPPTNNTMNTATSLTKPATFSAQTFHAICDELAATDSELQAIVARYGYPPMWTRPNTFETLVHVILEQQVSLASALASLRKLQEKTGGIAPEAILALTDDELRACYVSRQKSGYIKGLAAALETKTLELDKLENQNNDDIRSELTKLKGIGNWTVDVYLMFVLQRADIFPIGDLAAVNALKRVKTLPKETTREVMLAITAHWAPYRTVACMILWHYYLSAMGNKGLPI